LAWFGFHAQSDEKKFEVGGQFSSLRVPTRSVTLTTSALSITEARIPISVLAAALATTSRNIFRWKQKAISFRAIATLMLVEDTSSFWRKAGKRFDKFGVFAKARPGFVRFEKGTYRFGTGGCPTVFPRHLVASNLWPGRTSPSTWAA